MGIFFQIRDINVSTHSRLKAAGRYAHGQQLPYCVSTHSRLKAAGLYDGGTFYKFDDVSTHSRLKAAGSFQAWRKRLMRSFNTQPPEGGWQNRLKNSIVSLAFQHTAA